MHHFFGRPVHRRAFLGATTAALVGGVTRITPRAALADSSIGAWPFRVGTFNIKRGRGLDDVLDLERIARAIESMGVDVIGLQEVDRHYPSSDFVDQPRWLGQRLQMHHVYGVNVDNDPLEPGQPRRQYGTAILSRYPLLSWRNTYLPMFEGSQQRGLLEAVLRVNTVKVRVANTHLQHTDGVERQAQATRIIELLGSDLTKTFLVGDINADPGTPEVEILTEVFVDAWQAVGVGDGFTWRADDPTRRVDYVMASRDVPAEHIYVLSTRASDHLPVVCDYLLSR